MKRIIAISCSFVLLCSIFTIPVYATENNVTLSPMAEVITSDDIISSKTDVEDLLDKARGTSKPDTKSTWDIYLQDYIFNLNFVTTLYTNFNFSNHGGEIQVSVTCNSQNPSKIKMELYEAGKSECLTTLELNPSGKTVGRFYNLDMKTNYYFKFVSPNGYLVTGEGRLYKDIE